MEVGFIGLGNIGGPCAGHLLDAGHRVTVFDIDESAVDRIAPRGARTARSAAEVAAETDGVFLSLPTPAAAHEVAAGAGGLLDAARPGLVVWTSPPTRWALLAPCSLSAAGPGSTTSTVRCPAAPGRLRQVTLP